MNFIEEVSTLDNLIKIVCSNPFVKSCKYVKITLRKVSSSAFQAEKFTSTQAFHENIFKQQLVLWLEENVQNCYKQICLLCSDKTITYLFSKNSCKRLEKKAK